MLDVTMNISVTLDMDDIRRYLHNDDYYLGYKLSTNVLACGMHTICIFICLPPLYPSHDSPIVTFNCQSLKAAPQKYLLKDFEKYVSVENYLAPMTGVLLDRISWIIDNVIEELNKSQLAFMKKRS